MNWKDKNGKQVSRWKSYKGVIEKVCPICEKPFTTFISDNGKYCSIKCYHKSPTRGTRPRNRRIEICTFCNKKFERPVANFKEENKNYFCSQKCVGDWNAELGPHGSDIYNWLGGDFRPKEYKAGWARLKKEVRKRAKNKCENCGGTHKLMDVHHKIPIRLKNDITITNHLDNLQLLCRPCHIEAERLLRERLYPNQKVSLAFGDLPNV